VGKTRVNAGNTLSISITLAPTGEYDWTPRARLRCDSCQITLMTCSTRASDQVVVPLDCNRYDRFLTQPAIRHLITDIRRVKRCIIILIIIIITEYAERGLTLSNGRMSVHPSVSLSRRSTAAAACGWFAADRGCRCGQRHVESRLFACMLCTEKTAATGRERRFVSTSQPSPMITSRRLSGRANWRPASSFLSIYLSPASRLSFYEFFWQVSCQNAVN